MINYKNGKLVVDVEAIKAKAASAAKFAGKKTVEGAKAAKEVASDVYEKARAKSIEIATELEDRKYFSKQEKVAALEKALETAKAELEAELADEDQAIDSSELIDILKNYGVKIEDKESDSSKD